MLYLKLMVFALVFIYGSADFGAKNADNYGPYEVSWKHYDQCRGPKSVNLTEYITILQRLDNGDYNAYLNITFLDQAKVDEIKMAVYTVKDDQKTLLWNYFINKPCDHFMFSMYFWTKMGIKNCVIKKGHYTLDNNLTELMKIYVGKSFFYGNYLFKVIVSSKKGNIICFTFDPLFKKLQ